MSSGFVGTSQTSCLHHYFSLVVPIICTGPGHQYTLSGNCCDSLQIDCESLITT
jgi:hypothetical protein